MVKYTPPSETHKITPTTNDFIENKETCQPQKRPLKRRFLFAIDTPTDVPNIEVTKEPIIEVTSTPFIEISNTPIITPTPYITPTVIPSPTINITVAPTTSIITETPTINPTDIPTPNITSIPTPYITPSPIPNDYIDTSKRFPISICPVNLTAAEKQIVEEIINTDSGIHIASIETTTPIETYENICGYLYSYYFPLTIPFYGDVYAEWVFGHPVVEFGNFGEGMIMAYYYRMGVLYLGWDASTIQGLIRQSNKNLTYIDGLLQNVKSDTKHNVVMALCKKILSMAKYNASCYHIEEVFEKHKASCMGYSLTLLYACKRIGINAVYCEGKYNSPNSHHAWISVDNLYYDLGYAASHGDSFLGNSNTSNYYHYKKEDIPYYWLFT
jgi:transglutaminase/protease-like cytokinesis protein 3